MDGHQPQPNLNDSPATSMPSTTAEPRPIPPLPSDCCDSGCPVCVHDLYAQELERWKAAQRAGRDGAVP